MSAERSIVVLGGPAAGKTHYAGQMYGRLTRGRSSVKIAGGASDLTVLEDVLACLQDGRLAAHTPVDTMSELHCSLTFPGGEGVDLAWPDYGGEQVRTIVSSRQVPPAWGDALTRADGWVLFIRSGKIQTMDDAFTRRASPASASPAPHPWDDNAWYVELLQLAIAAAKLDLSRVLNRPRLAIVLSCWDEVVTDLTPAAFFARKLPLLAAFVRANWCVRDWEVWGVSALGRALSASSPDEDYVDRGPEQFGFAVPGAGGEPDPDLLLPILWLMQT